MPEDPTEPLISEARILTAPPESPHIQIEQPVPNSTASCKMLGSSSVVSREVSTVAEGPMVAVGVAEFTRLVQEDSGPGRHAG